MLVYISVLSPTNLLAQCSLIIDLNYNRWYLRDLFLYTLLFFQVV
jgi:hypothetical protein